MLVLLLIKNFSKNLHLMERRCTGYGNNSKSIRNVFGTTCEVKRVSPGHITGLYDFKDQEQHFTHDCSTLWAVQDPWCWMLRHDFVQGYIGENPIQDSTVRLQPKSWLGSTTIIVSNLATVGHRPEAAELSLTAPQPTQTETQFPDYPSLYTLVTGAEQ